MDKVTVVENRDQLHAWVQVLDRIISLQSYDESGMGWWIYPWDLEYCEDYLNKLLFEPLHNTTGIAVYTSYAVAAGAMGPHFLSPSMVWCEEYICRGIRDGRKVREAFIRIAKEKGANAIVCDNVPQCVREHSDEITRSLGFRPFSKRYVCL